MKRITYWPQFFLGLNFNWGALLGYAAVKGALGWPALLSLCRRHRLDAGLRHHYAHQDKEDDALIGVKSSALALGNKTRPWLFIFYAAAIVLWAAAGATAGSAFGSISAFRGGAAARLASPSSRARRFRRLPRKFKSNRLTGWLLLAALSRRMGSDERARFIRAHNGDRAPGLVPEIRLHLATEVTPLWQATESLLEKSQLPPPYWAFAWPGGQALARHVLDHPELARGRAVLDIGAGAASSPSPPRAAAARSPPPIPTLRRDAIALNARSTASHSTSSRRI